MKNFDWSRFKNYGLWVSVIALIPLVLHGFGVEVVPEQYQAITNTLLTILVSLGIISNPTTVTKGFSDDKVEQPELPQEGK